LSSYKPDQEWVHIWWAPFNDWALCLQKSAK